MTYIIGTTESFIMDGHSPEHARELAADNDPPFDSQAFLEWLLSNTCNGRCPQ